MILTLLWLAPDLSAGEGHGYVIGGHVRLDTLSERDQVSPLGSRVSIWATEGDFFESTITDMEGWYKLEGVPEGSYSTGAAREGFFPDYSETFRMNSNREQNFELSQDPDYDWGPQEAGDYSMGCAQAANSRVGIFWVFAAILLLRHTRRKH